MHEWIGKYLPGLGWGFAVLGIVLKFGFGVDGAVFFGAIPSSMILAGIIKRRGLRLRAARDVLAPGNVPDTVDVLYLRPFATDNRSIRYGLSSTPWARTIDEEIFHVARIRGRRVIAIANESERLPPSQVQWLRISSNDWEDEVEALCRRARQVVILMGGSDGVTRELSIAANPDLVCKLVVLMPLVSRHTLAEYWATVIAIIGASNLPSEASLGHLKTMPEGVPRGMFRRKIDATVGIPPASDPDLIEAHAILQHGITLAFNNFFAVRFGPKPAAWPMPPRTAGIQRVHPYNRLLGTVLRDPDY